MVRPDSFPQRRLPNQTLYDGSNAQEIYGMYGFQQNAVTLQEAFNFKNFIFQNVPEKENNMRHVNLQNGKLWAMTKKKDTIARADLGKFGGRQPDLIDEQVLKKKNITKMFVDREGVHCILVSDYELFYINWFGNQVHRISKLINQEEG